MHVIIVVINSILKQVIARTVAQKWGVRMEKKYKLPWHIKQYVKTELMDYTATKKLLKEVKDTRALLVATKRVEIIERVFARLNTEDRKVSDLIFIKHYSQAKAETEGIGKTTYYNVQNKVIYYTAKELELI